MNDLIDSIIMLIAKAMANRREYFSDHPRVESYAYDIISQVNEYLRTTGGDELYIGIAKGFFLFENKRYFGPTVIGKDFMNFAFAMKCGGFGFRKGLGIGDLKKFLDISALRTISVRTLSEARTLFSRYGIDHIRLGEPLTDNVGVDGGEEIAIWEVEAVEADVESPMLLFQDLYDVVAKAHASAAQDRAIDLDAISSICEEWVESIDRNFGDTMQYISYPDFESYSIGHSVRMACFACHFSLQMGWEKDEVVRITRAALLHDIGQAKIPGRILRKNGPLNDEESAIVQEHPEIGLRYLLEIQGAGPLDLAACWGHHVTSSGGGYPRQPSWAAHHPLVPLMRICDVFEALTAVRPHKAAMEPRGAYSVMLAEKKDFHLGMLAAFIRILGLYPPGSYVRLNDRRIGVVVRSGKQIDRPKITITREKGGEYLHRSDHYGIDLGKARYAALKVEKLLIEPPV